VTTPLLQVEDLRVHYHTERGAVRAVDGVSFTVNRGERFGMVGESGCGKTTTAMALLRLLREPARVESGRVLLDGVDLLSLSDRALRAVRWRDISLVPQGAMNALNPVMRVRDQIGDSIFTHEPSVSARQVSARVDDLLGMVGLPSRAADMFPHELSGGMKQRVCIAMAIALRPKLIVADEPTSALDVVVQRVVAQTLEEVVQRLDASLILIGHDMGLQAQLVDRLAVMYAGKVAEIGSVQEIFQRPTHPYTRMLISSLPSLRERRMPRAIPGLPPALLAPPPGCLFHPRCPHARAVCSEATPEPRPVNGGAHVAACHLFEEIVAAEGPAAARRGSA
jgi:peptide/nickel transport system ATP-binding protein